MSKQNTKKKIHELLIAQTTEQIEEQKGMHIALLHYKGKFVTESIFIKNHSEEWKSVRVLTEDDARNMFREYPGALLIHFHSANEDMQKCMPKLTRRCMNVPLDEKQMSIVEGFFSSDFKKAQSMPAEVSKVWYSRSPEIDLWLRTEVIWKERIQTLAANNKN